MENSLVSIVKEDLGTAREVFVEEFVKYPKNHGKVYTLGLATSEAILYSGIALLAYSQISNTAPPDEVVAAPVIATLGVRSGQKLAYSKDKILSSIKNIKSKYF
jgi:hypothetical protein